MEDRLRSLFVRFRNLPPSRRRLLLAGSLVAGVFLLLLMVSNHDTKPVHKADATVAPDRVGAPGSFPVPNDFRSMSIDTKESNAPLSLPVPSDAYKAASHESGGLFPETRVVYSAELSILTKEFAHSRSSLEEILERHRGYVAKLRMVGQPSASVLSATLRVPSSEYRATLAELKGVGLVEHEEEAADEITQQHSELEARLVNAQNEERRLQQLLQDRNAKDYDQSTLERQVGLLRGEIERIESERYASGSRVSFANVFFSLREERMAPAETIAAKLRNAAVGGFSDAFESVSAILLFLASRGPLLALWAVLLYVPARSLWRRYQRAYATSGSSLGA